MLNLVTNGEDLTIVGIVQPAEDAVSTALSSGINYLPSLVTHVSELAAESEIVQAQMADPDTNVLTGEPIVVDSDIDIDLESLFNIDTDALQDAFDTSSLTDSLSDSLDLSDAFDLDADSLDLSSAVDFSDMDLNLDLTGMDLSSIDMSDIDLSGMDLDFDLDLSSIDLSSIDLSELGEIDMSSLMSGVSINVSTESVAALASTILSGYADYAEANGLATYSDLSEDFSSYLTSDAAKSTLSNLLIEIMEENGEVSISSDGLEDMLGSIVSDYESYVAEQVGSGDEDETVSVSTADYLATGRAQEIFDTWAESHITVSGDITITDEQMEEIASALADGYASYAAENDLTTVESVQEGFSEYLASDEATATMSAGLMSMLDLSGLEEQMTAIVQSYTQSVMSAYTEALTEAVMSAMESQMASLETQMTAAMASQMAAVQEQITSAITEQMASLESQITSALSSTMESVMSEIVDQLSDSMETAMNELADSMEDALQIDEDALADAFEFNLDSDELMEIMTSLSSSGSTSYESTLESLGYLDENGLEEIDLYPKDFDSKDEVLAILDNYNELKRAAGDEDDVITYTDTVGTMMSSVTTIMDVISYVLIAFVSISLIVSSIMIGVITYISVLERTREIGILRAIGASKGNISQIFNAETLIIGLCAGLLGVGLSELLLIPINAVVHSVAGSTDINAVLTVSNAAILVALSMVLTFIGGLIPSGQAAKKDPVTALRTE